MCLVSAISVGPRRYANCIVVNTDAKLWNWLISCDKMGRPAIPCIFSVIHIIKLAKSVTYNNIEGKTNVSSAVKKLL